MHSIVLNNNKDIKQSCVFNFIQKLSSHDIINSGSRSYKGTAVTEAAAVEAATVVAVALVVVVVVVV